MAKPDINPQEWMGSIMDSIESIIESFSRNITFSDIGVIILQVQDIVQRLVSDDDITVRDKIITIMDFIIDNTDTPWLDDSMSDPFMKAMVPALVDYYLSQAPFSDAGEVDMVGSSWTTCLPGWFGSCALR